MCKTVIPKQQVFNTTASLTHGGVHSKVCLQPHAPAQKKGTASRSTTALRWCAGTTGTRFCWFPAARISSSNIVSCFLVETVKSAVASASSSCIYTHDKLLLYNPQVLNSNNLTDPTGLVQVLEVLFRKWRLASWQRALSTLAGGMSPWGKQYHGAMFPFS